MLTAEEQIKILQENAALYRQDIVNKITNARREMQHADKKSIAAIVALSISHILIDEYWKTDIDAENESKNGYYKNLLKKHIALLALDLVKRKLEQNLKERTGDGQ